MFSLILQIAVIIIMIIASVGFIGSAIVSQLEQNQ